MQQKTQFLPNMCPPWAAGKSIYSCCDIYVCFFLKWNSFPHTSIQLPLLIESFLPNAQSKLVTCRHTDTHTQTHTHTHTHVQTDPLYLVLCSDFFLVAAIITINIYSLVQCLCSSLEYKLQRGEGTLSYSWSVTEMTVSAWHIMNFQ